MNAIELLKTDHEKVKELFDQFEEASTVDEKRRIAAQACQELKIHSAIEEEIFYPAVRPAIDDDAIMDEADEEHHEAKVLIAELSTMNGSESHFDGKFTVLAENIRHHIEEEETDMLPKAADADLDLEGLGDEMERRKEELLEEGVPASAEERMVAASHGQGDSSAANAERAPARPGRKGKASE